MTTTFFTIQDKRIYRIDPVKFKALTMREAVAGPYVVRREWLTGDVQRYVGNDVAYFACAKKGPTFWLHEYFEGLRVEKDLGPEILDMTVESIGAFAPKEIEVFL